MLERNPNLSPCPAVARVVIKIVPNSQPAYALLPAVSRLRHAPDGQREYDEVSEDTRISQFVYHAGNMIPFFGMVQANRDHGEP